MALQLPGNSNPSWGRIGGDNPYLDESSDLLDVAEQLVDGFIGGFTTFEVGDEPKDDWGQMARSLGHLAGFIGFIPGMGTLGSIASKGLMTATGLSTVQKGFLAAGGVEKGVKALSATRAFAPKIGQFKSVPMLAADLVFKGAEKAGAGKAFKLASEFAAGKGVTEPTIEGISYILEGGLHLGTASGVSSWQHGIDAMADSFIHGAIAGGAFRGLGQVLPNAPGRTPTGNVIQNFKQALIDPATGELSPDSNGIIRILASSMFTGLPATLQAQSTPLQVYEYLLGAVFGAGEMSKPDRQAHEWITKEAFNITKGTKATIQAGQMALLAPDLQPSFKKLTPKVQEIVKANLLLRGFGLKNLQYQIAQTGEYETSSSYGGIELAKMVNKAVPETLTRIASLRANDLISESDFQQKVWEIQTAVGSAHLNEYYRNITAGMKAYNTKMGKGELTEEQKTEAWDRTTKRVSQEILDALLVEKQGSIEAPYDAERLKYETVEGKVHSEFTEIMNDIKENAPPFRNPSEKIGNDYYMEAVKRGHIKEDDLTNTTRVKHVIKVAKVINKALEKDKNNFESLRVAVEKETGLKIDKPHITKEGYVHDSVLYRELRAAFKANLREKVNVEELVINDEGDTWTLVPAGNVNSKGQRITQEKHRHFIKEILGEDVYFANLKQIKWQRQEYDLYDIKDITFSNKGKSYKFKKVQEITPAEIIYRLFAPKDADGLKKDIKDRKTLFIGAKDNSNIFVVGFLKGAQTVPEAHKTFDEVYRVLKETEGETSAERFKGRLEERIETFVNSAKIEGRGENHLILAKAAFKQQYANSLLIMAKLNGMSLSEYIVKSRAKDADGNPLYDFITSPTGLNKRGTLLNNGFDRVDPEYFTDITDIKDGKLNIAFINDIHSSGQNTKGKEEPKKHVFNKKGDVEETYHLAHVDGYFKLRDDIYERLSIQAGLDLESGSQKGTLVHTAEDGQGLVLGKYAYHKATKAESDAMRKHNLHGMMPKSAAKQRGTRELADVQWDNATKEWVITGKSHEIPIDAFTTTQGGEHAGLTLKDKAILSQMMSGLRADKHSNARKELNEIVNNTFNGLEVENEKARKHLNNPESIDVNDINIDKLGSQTILDIIYSGRDSKLYRKLLGEMSEVLRNREFVRDVENSPESQAEIQVQEGNRRAAEELLLLWDGMLTPGIVNNKLVSKYFNGMVKYYLINRVASPKMEGSFDSILQPYFGEVTGLVDLKPGEIILSERHAEIEIPWINKTTKKAKEAFDEYQTLLKSEKPDKEILKEMEENLSWVFQRVPTDSPSGIRVLKIAGFQPVKGSGVVMHPEDMENIGGADLDIDKVYGFTRFSKKFKDDIRSTMYENYDEATYKGKKVRIMKDAKNNDFFVKPSEEEPIDYTSVKKIPSERKRAVAARRLSDGTILLNETLLKRRYTQKAWTKPAVEGVKPLPKDYFKTYEDWKQFVLRHERAHGGLPKREGETKSQYENRINRRALIEEAKANKDYWNMFDASTMYEVNERATRGNRLLDPGIGATKILEGMAEYLKNSKKSLLINVDGKSHNLSYKDLDLPTFRLAKRALINKAADAADGENLKAAPEVVQELWSILTKGKGGIYSEIRNDNPIFKSLSDINKLKNGANREINKSNEKAHFYQAAHNNSLGMLQEAIESIANSKSFDINNLSSPYFQAYFKVSQLNFKKYRDLPFIGSNIKNQAEKIERQLRTIKDIDAILGIQPGTKTKQDPFGLKSFNEFKKTDLYQLVYSISPSEARLLYREIFSQDASVLTSADLLRYYVPKEYEREMLLSIHKKVAKFEDSLHQAVQESKVSLAERDYSNIERRLAEIDIERRAYLEDIPEKYHNFFHAATLSAISYQDRTLGEFVKKAQVKLSKEYSQKLDAIRNSEELDFMKSYRRKELIQEYSDKKKKVYHEAKTEWQKTNISDLPFRLNTIPSEMKVKFGELYNTMVQKIDAKIPDHELLKLEGFTYNKYVTEEMQYPSSERVSHDFLKLSTLLAKESNEQLPTRLKNEIEAITPKFVEALTHNPDILINIDMIFTGFMKNKAGMGGYGFVKTPRMSTAQDVIDFAKEIIDIHQKKGKPFPIKRHHWWMNRKKVAKALAKYEGRFVPEIALVQTPEKKGAAEVMVLDASLGTLGKTHNTVQIHGDAQRSIIEKDFEVSLGKRVERALNKITSGWGSKLYELAMDEHQERLGNKSQRRIEGEIDKALRELDSKEEPTVFKKNPKDKKSETFTLRGVEERLLTPEQKVLLERAINSVEKRHTDAYIKRSEATAEERAQLKADTKEYYIPALGKKLTAGKIMEWFQADEKIWANKVLNETISNSQKVEAFLKEERPLNDRILDGYGYIKLPQLARALSSNLKLGKPEFYSLDMIARITHQLMLENITLNPMAFFRAQLERVGYTLPAEITYAELVKDPAYKRLLADFEKNKGVEGVSQYTNAMFKVYRDIIENKEFGKKVKDLPTREDMNHAWEYLKDSAINHENWIEYKPLHEKLPEWWKDNYHPHMKFNQGALQRQLFKKILKAMNGQSSELEQTAALAAELKEESLAQIRAREEHNITEPGKILELSNLETGINESNIKDVLKTFSSLLERNRTEPLEEWKNEINNRLLYERGASRNYWASIAGFVGEQYANDFHNSGALGSTTKYWTKYLKTFNQQMVNGNSMMPLMNRADPNTGLKYNPYILLTDQYWQQKIKNIENKMFNGAKLFKKYTDLTDAEIKEITSDKTKYTFKVGNETKSMTKLALAQDLYYNDASTKLAMISNLEAKFELMTLLSHPKSFINNMIGGNLNTVSNIGVHHFKNAMDIKYLKENVFLDFETRDDVLRFVEKMGGIEAMFTAQFGLDPIFKTHKFNEMIDRVEDYFKKGNTYSEQSMREILKESGISEAVMNTAGWFMKESEVRLRSRAWMAHYLNVRQTLDASGFVLPEDHPWLVQWANKGVEATQFLYNNANRAPFARTHLGKIFSRFQLWAWNSLGFRRGVLKEAHEAGWEEGSAEFTRLQRLMTADVFVFALAKAFAMSTFDNTLAPPLSYLADFGEYFFGDDDKKRRAFYGILPYPANVVGVAAPPITRIPFTIITALADGSLEELSYRVTSWFPFGRIASSASRTINKPEKILQHFTGFPLDKISGYAEKIGEYEPRTPLFDTSDTSQSLKKREP